MLNLLIIALLSTTTLTEDLPELLSQLLLVAIAEVYVCRHSQMRVLRVQCYQIWNDETS